MGWCGLAARGRDLTIVNAIVSIGGSADLVAHLQVSKRKRDAIASKALVRLRVGEAVQDEMKKSTFQSAARVPSEMASACHLFSRQNRGSIIELTYGRGSRS
jgi:hypothetical protein